MTAESPERTDDGEEAAPDTSEAGQLATDQQGPEPDIAESGETVAALQEAGTHLEIEATSEEGERPDVQTPSEETGPPDAEAPTETEPAEGEGGAEVGEAPDVETPVQVEDSPEVETPVQDEAPVPEAPAVEEPAAADGDPFSGPGDWYVIHTYAGYENKVKTNLGSRIQTMQMQDKIFDVVVPMEDVMEIKSGRKQVVQKKVFPGYLLVKMVYDNDSWYVVRNTPGVTGFVSSGTGQKPTPLPRREVEKFLAAKTEETKPAFRLEYEEGDVVRIISGPFTEFTGTISEINMDQSKLKVMVNIFDRETPVELGFDQVAKV
jgi:transcriptional antiterminator NusG